MKFNKFIIMLVLSVNIVSCIERDEDSSGDYTVSSQIEKFSSQLFNTSWTYQHTDFYEKDNGRYSYTSTEFANKFTFTFSNETSHNDAYRLLVNGNSEYACFWYVNEDGLTYSASEYGSNFLKMTASQVGKWGNCGGLLVGAHISTHTNSTLILKDYWSDGIRYKQHVYTASSNPSGGSGGGSSSCEKPDVGFYDFTATKSSLKVQYKIYNKDEAGVKSAKIYYGTTNNPTKSITASVSGTQITANITGLKAGTTYYVKCSVIGKAGTTTTEVTKCITNY